MSVDIHPPGNEKVAFGHLIVVAVEILFDKKKGWKAGDGHIILEGTGVVTLVGSNGK